MTLQRYGRHLNFVNYYVAEASTPSYGPLPVAVTSGYHAARSRISFFVARRSVEALISPSGREGAVYDCTSFGAPASFPPACRGTARGAVFHLIVCVLQHWQRAPVNQHTRFIDQ